MSPGALGVSIHFGIALIIGVSLFILRDKKDPGGAIGRAACALFWLIFLGLYGYETFRAAKGGRREVGRSLGVVDVVRMVVKKVENFNYFYGLPFGAEWD